MKSKPWIKGKGNEGAEQRLAALYLDRLNIVWRHVPNGGARNAVTGAQLKAQGAKAGVFDVEILTPSPLARFAGARGLAIELKAPRATAHMRDTEARWRSSAVSESQRAWREHYRECGWLTALCYGFDELRAQVQRWGWG